MKTNRPPWFVYLSAFALASAAIGCGPGVGDLTGKVTYQNKTVSSGTVTVAGSDGVPMSGDISDDGRYEVKGIAAGSVKITVNSPNPAEFKTAQRKKDQEMPPPKDASKWFAIPEDYGDFAKTSLTHQLKRGPNSLDLELK